MKSLQRYGAAITNYEGVANITFPEDSGKVYKGYFEAKTVESRGHSYRLSTAFSMMKITRAGQPL